MFNVLLDETLRCDECLREQDEDSIYSETEVGVCDECGATGLTGSQQVHVLVVSNGIRAAEEWARRYGLNPSHTAFLSAADPRSAEGLRGQLFQRRAVVVLPYAEHGRYIHELDAILATLTNGLYGMPVNQNRVVTFTSTANFTAHTHTTAAMMQQFANQIVRTNKTVATLSGVTP